MKEYISPTAEEFSAQATDVITAGGDGIVSAYHQSRSIQTMESEWKNTWN